MNSHVGELMVKRLMDGCTDSVNKIPLCYSFIYLAATSVFCFNMFHNSLGIEHPKPQPRAYEAGKAAAKAQAEARSQRFLGFEEFLCQASGAV